MCDNEYITNGLNQQAMALVDDYVNKIEIKGITKKIHELEGKPPMITYVIEGSEGTTQNVMMYGHLDKQPWLDGWDEGLSPTDPVIRGEYMYGRGGADDGYSIFTCMLAIKNAQLQGIKYPRCCMVLETEEESGSPNLKDLLIAAKEEIGTPDFLFCMDSGAFDYNQLWVTSSLRGIYLTDMTVQCGEVGYHSGETGGIIPETFRVIRELLDRIDDSKTGEVKLPELVAKLPEYVPAEAKKMAALGGETMFKKYKVVDGVKCMSQDNLEQMYLNNTWKANLSITGAAGLPPT